MILVHLPEAHRLHAQNGAKKYLQLMLVMANLHRLRTDEKVVCMERTNIRYVTLEDTKEPADLHIDVLLYPKDNNASNFKLAKDIG